MSDEEFKTLLNIVDKLEKRIFLLEKEYKNIIGKQIEEQEEIVEDMYPIQSDVLAVALDYIPTKVLKRIIARYK